MPAGTPNLDPVSLGLSAATAGYKIYDSIRKDREAKKLEANNKRPIYKADGSIQEVLDIATTELSDDYNKDFVAQQLQQNQSAGIDAILKSGGKADFETINSTFGKGLQHGLNQIMMERDRKIANYNNAAYNKAASKDAEFQYNQDAPYKDKQQRAAMLRGQSEQSLNEAFGLAAEGIANYGTANLTPGQYGVTGDINPITAESLRINQQLAGGYNSSGNTIGIIGSSAGALEAAGRITSASGQ